MKKFKGSGFLVSVLIAAIITSAMAISTVEVNSSVFNSLLSSKIELLHSKGFDGITTQNKSKIGDTSFYDEIVLGDESIYTGSIKQKPVIVNVYNEDEELPRYSLNSILYSATTASVGGCQIETGTGSVSFSANGSYKSLTIIVASKFTPADGTWTGTATCTGYVNGTSVGTITTQSTTSKGGSKGHYWGTTEAVTNMQTFKKDISNGDTIKASITSSSRHSGSTITVILGT